MGSSVTSVTSARNRCRSSERPRRDSVCDLHRRPRDRLAIGGSGAACLLGAVAGPGLFERRQVPGAEVHRISRVVHLSRSDEGSGVQTDEVSPLAGFKVLQAALPSLHSLDSEMPGGQAGAGRLHPRSHLSESTARAMGECTLFAWSYDFVAARRCPPDGTRSGQRVPSRRHAHAAGNERGSSRAWCLRRRRSRPKRVYLSRRKRSRRSAPVTSVPSLREASVTARSSCSAAACCHAR